MLQVNDNPRLLDLMLDDSRHAPMEYQPTNYWRVYEERSVPELRQRGLRDFRRRKNSVLGSFGATDLYPKQIDFQNGAVCNNWLAKVMSFRNRWPRLLNSLAHMRLMSGAGFQRLKRLLSSSTSCYYDITVEDLRQISYAFVRAQGELAGAKSIDELEASLAGNPEDAFLVGDRVYTMATFFYYLQYVYCSRFLKFDDIRLYVELGGGLGKQVEVLKKLFPHLCFLLFDIPPQSYVCEQYLSAVFPGDVVSYEVTRDFQELPTPESGKIFMFGAWKFPLLDRAYIDLFWNAASFQEMEPETVANYLHFINRRARYVFLHEVMGGKEVAKRAGLEGVLRQTKLEDYQRGLPDFELVNMSSSRKPAGHPLPKHFNSIWRRKHGG